MVNHREAIAIFELAVYVPFFAISLFVSVRHGFMKQLGWLYVNIFCGLRIASAALAITSVHNPTSTTDAAWAAILSSIGLSPLLLALLGLLKTVNDSIKTSSWRPLALRLSHIPCLVGLILGIIGGTDLEHDSASKHKTGLDFLKGSGILFLVAYLVVFAISALTLPYLRKLPSSEVKILVAVLASLPFLAVRVLYALLAAFVDNKDFSVIGPDVFVQLGMAIVMEMVVVAGFLIAGVLAEPTARRQASHPNQMAKQMNQGQPVSQQQV